jgi:hypothetical protein
MASKLPGKSRRSSFCDSVSLAEAAVKEKATVMPAATSVNKGRIRCSGSCLVASRGPAYWAAHYPCTAYCDVVAPRCIDLNQGKAVDPATVRQCLSGRDCQLFRFLARMRCEIGAAIGLLWGGGGQISLRTRRSPRVQIRVIDFGAICCLDEHPAPPSPQLQPAAKPR